MKHCLLWFLILLVCISLSCNLPQSNAGNNQVLIDDVTIYPKSGSGEFDVVVSISKHDNLDTVECYVDGSRGRVVEHTEKIFADDGRTGIIFSFSFTEPGEHYLVCEAQDSGSSWPDGFTVVPDSNAPKTILLTPSANQPPVKVSLPVILNPGFEEGSNFFDPWYDLPAALQYGGQSVDETVIKYSGNHSHKMFLRYGGSYIVQRIPVDPPLPLNSRLTLSVFVMMPFPGEKTNKCFSLELVIGNGSQQKTLELTCIMPCQAGHHFRLIS